MLVVAGSISKYVTKGASNNDIVTFDLRIDNSNIVTCDSTFLTCNAANYIGTIQLDGSSETYQYGTDNCSTTDSTNCPIISYSLLYTNNTALTSSDEPISIDSSTGAITGERTQTLSFDFLV